MCYQTHISVTPQKIIYYYDKQEAAFPLQSNNSVLLSRFESQLEFESTCCKIRFEEWLVWIPCMIWDFRAWSFPILFLACSKCNLCSTVSCIPLILNVIQLLLTLQSMNHCLACFMHLKLNLQVCICSKVFLFTIDFEFISLNHAFQWGFHYHRGDIHLKWMPILFYRAFQMVFRTSWIRNHFFNAIYKIKIMMSFFISTFFLLSFCMCISETVWSVKELGKWNLRVRMGGSVAES